MTRVHVRLLGPCFKTGQADHTGFRLRFLSRAKLLLTDNQHAQHATVARPHIIRTLLAKSIDRDKRLLANDSTTAAVFGNQGSQTQSASADTQHLKYLFSCT